MKINILVLNYNGRDLLKECLPSVVEAAGRSSFPCSVTVVDNVSTDDSLDLLKKDFSSVKIYSASANKVLCSYNEAISSIDEDLVIMLNNDIKVDPGFVDPLVEMFEKHDDAFLVGPKCLGFDEKTYEGTRAKPFFRMGMFTAVSRYPGHELEMDLQGLTMQSPFGVFDRKKFLSLGGFDEVYMPGIMEEADLCYRAYKNGFRCYYQPRSLIYHKGQVTFKKYYTDKKALSIAHRNSFIFFWKNIFDGVFLLKHAVFLPMRLLGALLRGKTEIISGFFKAVYRAPAVIAARRRAAKDFKITDKMVMEELDRNIIIPESEGDMNKLSALMIARNEENNIAQCLEALKWADEIVVVDSGSSDRTAEVARKYTDKVYENDFKDFSSQKNFALSKATGDWVLFLDADERIGEELREKIKEAVRSATGLGGYYIKRNTYIFGRLMKKGGHDRDYQLRLFKRKGAHFYQPVHEKLALEEPGTGFIEEALIHYSTADLKEYFEKLDLYTDLEAEFIAAQGKPVGIFLLYCKPVLRFLKQYIWQQGFMDGFAGLKFYALSAYYDFVKYSKCRGMCEKK